MRAPSTITKSEGNLQPLIAATAKLRRKYHLSYNQACYVCKEVR
jgi:hypothetical protein